MEPFNENLGCHTTPEIDSTIRPTVHTNPSRKRNFSKVSSNRRNLKTLALRFRVEENILKTEFYWSCDSSAWVFLEQKPKLTDDCYVFKFLWRCVDETAIKKGKLSAPFSYKREKCVNLTLASDELRKRWILLLLLTATKAWILQLIALSGEKSTSFTILFTQQSRKCENFILGGNKKARVTMSSATTQQKDTNILQ